MDIVRDIWCVFYEDGDHTGPMILWSIWNNEEAAREESERMNIRAITPWSPAGSRFMVERWDLHSGGVNG